MCVYYYNLLEKEGFHDGHVTQKGETDAGILLHHCLASQPRIFTAVKTSDLAYGTVINQGYRRITFTCAD
jgi:hypothetical protein